MTRNPHIDPEPGDVVEAKSGVIRKVIEIRGKELPNPRVIFMARRMGGAGWREGNWINEWRRWCERNAV